MLWVVYRNSRQARLPVIMDIMARIQDLGDFEREVIVGAGLTWVSVMKADQLADVSRWTVSEVMSRWNSEGETPPTKGSCGQKCVLEHSFNQEWSTENATEQDTIVRLQCTNNPLDLVLIAQGTNYRDVEKCDFSRWIISTKGRLLMWHTC